MPIAERLGLVRLIDHRMLELVIAELVAAPQLTLSVNVSPASIIDGTWWNGLAAALAAHPDLAPRLIVELTESAAIQNLDETRSFVTRGGTPAAASRSTTSAPAARRSATCAG